MSKERIEHIEQYLMDKLNPAEVTAFETEIENDAALAAEVIDMRNTLKGIGRHFEEKAWIRNMHERLKSEGKLLTYKDLKGSK